MDKNKSKSGLRTLSLVKFMHTLTMAVTTTKLLFTNERISGSKECAGAGRFCWKPSSPLHWPIFCIPDTASSMTSSSKSVRRPS